MSFHFVIWKCFIAVKWSHEEHGYCKDDTHHRRPFVWVKRSAYEQEGLWLFIGLANQNHTIVGWTCFNGLDFSLTGSPVKFPHWDDCADLCFLGYPGLTGLWSEAGSASSFCAWNRCRSSSCLVPGSKLDWRAWWSVGSSFWLFSLAVLWQVWALGIMMIPCLRNWLPCLPLKVFPVLLLHGGFPRSVVKIIQKL